MHLPLSLSVRIHSDPDAKLFDKDDEKFRSFALLKFNGSLLGSSVAKIGVRTDSFLMALAQWTGKVIKF